MAIVFFLVSLIASIVTFFGIFYMKRYNHPTQNSLQKLFVVVILSAMFSATAYIVPNETAANLLHGLYFASTGWMGLILVYFVRQYDNAKPLPFAVEAGLVLLLLADSFMMITNIYTHGIYTCEPVWLSGRLCYDAVPIMPESGIPYYAVHLILNYAMVLFSWVMIILFRQRTYKIYRGRYTPIILSYLFIVIINIWMRLTNVPMDISSLLYMLVAWQLFYFTMVFVSKNVMLRLLSQSIAYLNSAVFCFDKDGNCLFANDMAKSIFHAEKDMTPFEEYFKAWHEGKKDEDLREETWQEERQEGGETRYYENQFHFLLDNKGAYIGSFFAVTDRTEAVRELEMEHYNATHDYLTDIYNRERFFEVVEDYLKKHPDEERVILGMDIKDFKLINDLFGEETGNKVLKRVAGLMRREASADTFYARLEADHFAMCMRKENFVEEDYSDYLDELKKIVHSSLYRMHGHVGVYEITDPELSISGMCDRAFVAIDKIKDSYEDIVSYYSDDMGAEEQLEKLLVAEFDRAIRSGEFQMFLQPQISADKHSVLGAEALVRWMHPVRGMISPAVFIPVFEKSGNITRLDHYMWEMACKQLREWKEKGREDIHISVNISPKDFFLLDLYETFTSLVQKYDIAPANLKLEITETALMEDIAKHLSLLTKLRDYGFQVEIDDFGSGYSSLNTLQDIEVDVLKLDMGFLRKTSHEKRSRTIMNSVIEMSKNLGLTVVTEGVETEDQVKYLTTAGCDVFQGYYFAKPMPVKEFEEKYLDLSGTERQ